MGLADLTDPAAVSEAMAEFRALGRDGFLAKYGFGRAERYFVVADGQRFDSKAIVGAAHGVQFPDQGPLRSADFSGGQATVKATLERLGFEVQVVSDRAKEVIDRLTNLNRAVTGAEGSAPHKPLLVLLAIARAAAGEPRLTPFAVLEGPLAGLLGRFNPVDTPARPELPFWHLQGDGVWEVLDHGAPLEVDGGSAVPALGVLRRDGVEGGLVESVFEVVRDRADGRAVEVAVADHYFSARAGEVLDAVAKLVTGGGDSRVWWVNQGRTYDAEFTGGYVWAPVVMKNGRASRFHTNVSRLKVGDVVVHYAERAIRAVSQVRCAPEVRERPPELPVEPWGVEGHFCRVEYFPLDEPIGLDEIPDRSDADGPFDHAGAVKQSYLFEVTDAFEDRLRTEFAGRWPAGSPLADGQRRYWLFQANPKVWSLEAFLAGATKGTTEGWTASRYRGEMQPGDGVVLWQSGPEASVRAFARLSGGPFERPRPEWKPDDAPPTDWAVPLVVDTILTDPVTRETLQQDPVLADLDVFKFHQATNFRLTEEQWFRLQQVAFTTSPSDGWDEFVHWARKLYEPREWFDQAERTYKLKIGGHLTAAREALAGDLGGEQWRGLLRRSFGPPNNLTSFYMHQKYLQWVADEPAAAAEGLQTLWADATDRAEALRGFLAGLPTAVISGTGTRANLASFLCMATDIGAFPVFKTTPFRRAYQLTGFAPAAPDATETDLIEHAWAFLDEFITQAHTRGLEISDRLDAQGLVWTITSGSPPEHWDQHDKDAFIAYVKGTAMEEPTSLQALADQLFLPVEFLDQITRLLRDKRQVVFYGPPGTGKTYVARELAALLSGPDGTVTKVQFHPSYAYEDFVEGYRPRETSSGQPGFELVQGPLRQAAEAAASDPLSTHVLLIDEINRANIAKVLGELYYLLEYRDDTIRLQYSDDDFQLPANLWIIATMNSADRSIALVDAALRRRFHFVGFFPDEEPIQGLLRRWLTANRPDMLDVADIVDRANAKLQDRHLAIGPSHFLRKDLDHDTLEMVWTYSVLPYLAEQYFGNEDALGEFTLAALRTPTANLGDVDPDATS